MNGSLDNMSVHQGNGWRNVGSAAVVLPQGARRVRILGIDIDDLAFEDAIAHLGMLARSRRQTTLFVANANTIELACASPAFRRVLDEADLRFGDGTGVRWAARILGHDLKANLNGTDLIPAFMRSQFSHQIRYFLLGATPDVIGETAEVMARTYPHATLAGYHHGFLDSSNEADVIRSINASGTQLLLVGMGNPLQECWIARNRDKLSANLIVGVGGLFNYISGNYRRAPRFMRRRGLEWLAILFTQRQKWRRYVIGAPRFMLRVLLQRLRRGRRAAPLHRADCRSI